jgi:hypothetical protein
MNYPYIANKTMFAAVMFACKMIRENGYFNQAVTRAANYYGVNKTELAKNIRARQSAGQKAKYKPKNTRKYKWFTCYVHVLNDMGYSVRSPQVRKGISENNVFKVLSYDDNGGSWFIEETLRTIKEYDTKQEAEKNLEEDFKPIRELAERQ